MYFEGFGDDLKDGHAGVEGVVGVLKDHLDLFAVIEEVATRDVGDVIALVEDVAVCGGGELYDCATDGSFSAAGFADEADGCALFYFKGYTIDGFDDATFEVEEAAVDWVVDVEIFNFEKRGIDVGFLVHCIRN